MRANKTIPVTLDLSHFALNDTKSPEYPSINLYSKGVLSIPDFRNRFDILLCILIQNRLITVNKDLYNQLTALYQKTEFSEEDLQRFETLLKEIKAYDYDEVKAAETETVPVKSERQVNLTAIQGGEDYFTFLLINKLIDLKINLRILSADHNDVLRKMTFQTLVSYTKLFNDAELSSKSLCRFISNDLIEKKVDALILNYRLCYESQVKETSQTLTTQPSQTPQPNAPQNTTETRSPIKLPHVEHQSTDDITSHADVKTAGDKQCIGYALILLGTLAIAAAITVLTAAIIAATGGSALPFFILPLMELTTPGIIGYSALFAVGTSAAFLVGDHLSKPSHNLSKFGTFSNSEPPPLKQKNSRPAIQQEPQDPQDQKNTKDPRRGGFNYIHNPSG